jgi:DNA modification methylase
MGLSYEMILSAGAVKLRGSRDNSVLRYNTTPSANRNHPTEKPIALIEYLIQKVTDPNAVVLDPFMGSGTTGVACAKIDRKVIGIEIEPKYFDIACKRIEEAYRQPDMFIQSGQKPESQTEQVRLFAKTGHS